MDYKDDPYIAHLVEEGHIEILENEFGEQVAKVNDSLQAVDPELYETIENQARDLIETLMEAGFVAAGVDEIDGEIEEYYYATEEGVEVFRRLIAARAYRGIQMSLGLD